MPRHQVMPSSASGRTDIPGASVFEPQQHGGFSGWFFFFSRTEIGRVMSSQTFPEFLFCSSHFLGREKKKCKKKKKSIFFFPQVRLFHTSCLRRILHFFCTDISSPNVPQRNLKK